MNGVKEEFVNRNIGEKLSFDEIVAVITRGHFGVNPVEYKGIICGVSSGIEQAIFSGCISNHEVLEAVDRFLACDWGDFYDIPGDVISPGKEYGQYPSSLGSKLENGAIMIHRTKHEPVIWDVVVYFHFER